MVKVWSEDEPEGRACSYPVSNFIEAAERHAEAHSLSLFAFDDEVILSTRVGPSEVRKVRVVKIDRPTFSGSAVNTLPQGEE